VRDLAYVKPQEPFKWLFNIPGSEPTADVIQVLFTEPIRNETFGIEDIILTLDGERVDTSGLRIKSLGDAFPVAFTIENIAAVASDVGTYEIKIEASGIEDLDGNRGTGQVRDSWSVTGDRPYVESVSGFTGPTTTKPIIQPIKVRFSEPLQPGSFTWEDLQISRDEGINLSNDSIVVTQIDDRTYEVSNLEGITDIGGTYTFLATAKNVRDADGNRGIDAKGFTWTLDASAPAVIGTSWVSSSRDKALPELQIRFSKPIAPESFDTNDLQLRFNNQQIDLTSAVTVSKLNDTDYKISGLTGLQTTDGVYELAILSAGVTDD